MEEEEEEDFGADFWRRKERGEERGPNISEECASGDKSDKR